MSDGLTFHAPRQSERTRPQRLFGPPDEQLAYEARLERARADGLVIRPSPTINDPAANCTKRDGSWYQVWASAGSDIIDTLPGFPVSFACQCPAGQRHFPPGQTGCKHTALLAFELVGRRMITLDFEGRFRAPEANFGLAGQAFPNTTPATLGVMTTSTRTQPSGDLTLDLVTSRYQSCQKVLDAGYVPIGTSNGNPRFKLPVSLAGQFVRLVAPDRPLMALDGQAFIDGYRAQLDRIGVDTIRRALEAMAAHVGSGRCALLCFEDVHAGQLCHRRVLAGWLEEHGWPTIREL